MSNKSFFYLAVCVLTACLVAGCKTTPPKTQIKMRCKPSDAVGFGSSVCTPVQPGGVSIMGVDDGIITFTVEE